jgi:serine/threonine protein kinase
MHPHIVPVFDVGILDDTPFMALEYLSGGDLSQRISNDAGLHLLPLLIQAGQALGALHAAGIVHGDFKPANLLLSETAEIKLADFGLAANERTLVSRQLDLQGCTSAQSYLARLEHENVSPDIEALGGGTPGFMAPEIHLGMAPSRSRALASLCPKCRNSACFCWRRPKRRRRLCLKCPKAGSRA